MWHQVLLILTFYHASVSQMYLTPLPSFSILMLILSVNLTGHRVTVETNLWTCPWHVYGEFLDQVKGAGETDPL